jgi:signal transduction histidine kinase
VTARRARSTADRADALDELVSRVTTAPARGELREELARVLGDRSLRVVYWYERKERYVDRRGRTFELPEPGDPKRAWTPVVHEGRPVAAIVHEAGLAGDKQVARAAAELGPVFEREGIEAQLRASLAAARSARSRILEAEQKSRRRLERDLHDGAQQRLVSLALELKLARAKIEKDPAGAGEMLDRADEGLRHAIEEVREIARGIHPAVLTDRGLAPALTGLVGRSPVPVDLDIVIEDRMPERVEAAVYFVVAEALTNVAKHAKASSVAVNVLQKNDMALVQIKDDGVGGADIRHGSGLNGLADRVAALDGQLEVDSYPGEGTVIYAEIPCA